MQEENTVREWPKWQMYAVLMDNPHGYREDEIALRADSVGVKVFYVGVDFLSETCAVTFATLPTEMKGGEAMQRIFESIGAKFAEGSTASVFAGFAQLKKCVCEQRETAEQRAKTDRLIAGGLENPDVLSISPQNPSAPMAFNSSAPLFNELMDEVNAKWSPKPN